MLKGSLWAMLAAGVMMSIGCGFQQGTAESSSAAKGGLAVIDLDVVAKSIGRTQEINESWQVRKNALDQALQKLQANFNEQLTAKKTEFGETPTEEQTKQLAAMRQDAANKLVQAGRTAQGDLEKYRQKMVADFRAEMRPYAQQVASSKGLGIVIPKNEGFLLSVDPGVDITADVISAYAAKSPAAKPSATTAAKPLTPAPAAPAETAAAPEAETTR
ncbi:hypothetical protein GC163_05175 [bacterium]|nr:hypothetical protein [bacterium]